MGLRNLGQSAGLDLVDEPAHAVLVRKERAGLDARDVLAHVLVEIREGFRGPLWTDARLLLDLAAKRILGQGAEGYREALEFIVQEVGAAR